MIDKAKAFTLLKTNYPESVQDVAHRKDDAAPISDCGDYTIAMSEAWRFEGDDALVFQLQIVNRTKRRIEHLPELLTIKVGDKQFTPSVTDLPTMIPPEGSVSGFVLLAGSPTGPRNGIALHNEFLFALARVTPDVESALEAFDSPTSLSK